MGKMGRQNQKGFDQRNQQDKEHHIWNCAEQLVALLGDKKKWNEGDGGSNRTDRNRPDHRSCSGYRGIQSVLAVFSFHCNVLTDHDCIIDDNANHQKERKNRAQIQSQIGGLEEQQSSDERQRNSERDPRCLSQVKYRNQAQKNDCQSDQAV